MLLGNNWKWWLIKHIENLVKSCVWGKEGGCWHALPGGTYKPEGAVLDEQGKPVQTPADEPAVLQAAACCALCNDSSLSYNAGALAPLAWSPPFTPLSRWCERPFEAAPGQPCALWQR